MIYFLDTNTCIYFLNGTSTSIRDKLLSTIPSAVKIPSIVKAELIFGAYKSKRKEENLIKIRTFLEPFEVISFSESMADIYAEIRSSCEKSGKPVGPNDLLIASTVLFYSGILVTNNQSEFEMVSNLQVVNWFQ